MTQNCPNSYDKPFCMLYESFAHNSGQVRGQRSRSLGVKMAIFDGNFTYLALFMALVCLEIHFIWHQTVITVRISPFVCYMSLLHTFKVRSEVKGQGHCGLKDHF